MTVFAIFCLIVGVLFLVIGIIGLLGVAGKKPGIVFTASGVVAVICAIVVFTVGSSTNSSSSSSSSSSYSSFTNEYGTRTTKCAHPGCSNYIASSGDTAYCTTHSNRCLNCGKYIDEDAMYCMDCLRNAING